MLSYTGNRSPGPRSFRLGKDGRGQKGLSAFPQEERQARCKTDGRGLSHACNGPTRQGGASLIEAMVAIVVLSIGMLSMAWQHSVSLKYDKMSQFRGVATQLGSELADRLRANVGAFNSYVYVEPYAPSVIETHSFDCAANVCSGAQMAAFDLVEFRNAARRSLPDGALLIVQDAPNSRSMTIWLMWRDPEAIDSEATAASLAGQCPASIGKPSPMPQCMPLRVLL